MRFPTPPPLKPKPAAPALPPQLRPARPQRAMFVIGVSVALWMLFALFVAGLILWLIGPLYSRFASPAIVIVTVLLLFLWIGFNVGWRMGNFIIFEALKTGKPSGSGPDRAV